MQNLDVFSYIYTLIATKRQPSNNDCNVFVIKKATELLFLLCYNTTGPIQTYFFNDLKIILKTVIDPSERGVNVVFTLQVMRFTTLKSFARNVLVLVP